MNRLIVIVGPTAVGKSRIALQLAQRFAGEIISGDSMCVYRGLDIGTAKPSIAEQQSVRHHLIDIKDPIEPFSVVEFQKLATDTINEVNQRGVLPILVGGTGLYVQALLEGFQFSATPKTSLREQLSSEESSVLTDLLHQKLQQLDPVSAARIHPNDRKRIVRALEVTTTEHQPISQSKRTTAAELSFDCIVLGLNMERQLLYSRIDARVDQMIESGLLDEVTNLIAAGIPAESTALQAIGYKELVDCEKGSLALFGAIQQIKQSSRRYAKRQMTWFRRMPYIHWIELKPDLNEEHILEIISGQVAERFAIK